MAKVDDPKISKPIIREPEPAGTPIERKDPPDGDKGEAPTVPKTSGAPVRDTRDSPAPNPDGPSKGKAPLTPKPLRDPLAKRRSDAPRQAGVTPRPTDEID